MYGREDTAAQGEGDSKRSPLLVSMDGMGKHRRRREAVVSVGVGEGEKCSVMYNEGKRGEFVAYSPHIWRNGASRSIQIDRARGHHVNRITPLDNIAIAMVSDH